MPAQISLKLRIIYYFKNINEHHVENVENGSREQFPIDRYSRSSVLELQL